MREHCVLVIPAVLLLAAPTGATGPNGDSRVQRFTRGIHVGLSVGGLAGASAEKGECSSAGGLTCSPELTHERKLGLQISPTLEAVAMAGVSGEFRFGLGVRAVPFGRLSLGRELHLAIVPEAVFPLDDDWAVTARFFNSLVIDAPPEEVLSRQQSVVDECRRAARAGEGNCSNSRSYVSFALELGVGLMRRYPGYRVRYQLGGQFTIDQRHAMGHVYTGEDEDESKRYRYATWSVESQRVVASVGLEW